MPLFVRFVQQMIQRYLRHGVGIQSAALAFYLLFTLFPFLIFLSSLLGLLHLNLASLLESLGQLLPKEVVSLAEVYLLYIAEHSTVKLLLFGLFFSFYFPMRATNALMRGVRTAYRLGAPLHPIAHTAKTLFYTLLLMTTIALTLTVMTIGERVLTFAVGTLGLPQMVADLWQWARFPLLAAVVYLALYALYALSQDKRPSWRCVAPGAMAALVAWMGISYGYGYYVDYSANYHQLYGSIATVIVLLVWLQMSANILLLGAECNATLQSIAPLQHTKNEIH